MTSNRHILPVLLISIALSTFGCDKNTRTSSVDYQTSVATPEWYDASDYDTVTVLSWNVEHFVDDFDNPYIENRRENNPSEDLKKRRMLLAEAIKRVDADIVVFQEIESGSFVQEFAEMYLPEMGYNAFAAAESPDWYMNVVAMSRIPFGMTYSYANAHTSYMEESDEDSTIIEKKIQNFINNRMWSVDVLVNPKYSFTLTGVHLKAGRGDRNESWRTGQMELMRSFLSQLQHIDSDRNHLLVGDFNATPESDEIQYLLGDQASSLRFVDPLAGTGVHSHPSDSTFWRIDHILPSTTMMPEIVEKKTLVIKPMAGDTMSQISDHLPLLVKVVASDR